MVTFALHCLLCHIFASSILEPTCHYLLLVHAYLLTSTCSVAHEGAWTQLLLNGLQRNCNTPVNMIASSEVVLAGLFNLQLADAPAALPVIETQAGDVSAYIPTNATWLNGRKPGGFLCWAIGSQHLSGL